MVGRAGRGTQEVGKGAFAHTGRTRYVDRWRATHVEEEAEALLLCCCVRPRLLALKQCRGWQRASLPRLEAPVSVELECR